MASVVRGTSLRAGGACGMYPGATRPSPSPRPRRDELLTRLGQQSGAGRERLSVSMRMAALPARTAPKACMSAISPRRAWLITTASRPPGSTSPVPVRAFRAQSVTRPPSPSAQLPPLRRPSAPALSSLTVRSKPPIFSFSLPPPPLALVSVAGSVGPRPRPQHVCLFGASSSSPPGLLLSLSLSLFPPSSPPTVGALYCTKEGVAGRCADRTPLPSPSSSLQRPTSRPSSFKATRRALSLVWRPCRLPRFGCPQDL